MMYRDAYLTHLYNRIFLRKIFERISCEIRAEESGGRAEDERVTGASSFAEPEITLIVSENRIRWNGRVNVHY